MTDDRIFTGFQLTSILTKYTYRIQYMYMMSQTFNISLPEPLVKKADRFAKKQYSTRSDLIREALWAYLKDRDEWDDLLAYGKEAGKKMGIRSEADVNKIVKEYRREKWQKLKSSPTPIS